MPKDLEKYQYFTVGLLKDSFALESLKADAMKHHMIEHPAQLIALRLTEYYDLLAQVRPPLPNVPFSAAKKLDIELSSETTSSVEIEPQPSDEPVEEIISASPDAEQNADEAADYWATL